jgi:hypothetical protein
MLSAFRLDLKPFCGSETPRDLISGGLAALAESDSAGV